MRKKLRELLEVVNIETQKAKKDAVSTHVSAMEITASARHSPSQSGDREHATNQATITAKRYENLLSLQHELESALNFVPETVSAPCYIRLVTEKNDVHELYFVSKPFFIEKYTFVSCESSLGASCLNKKVGEKILLGENVWIVQEIE